jgi:hypothetical protein
LSEPDDASPRPPSSGYRPIAETIGIVLIAFVMIGIQLVTGIQGLFKGALIAVLAAAGLLWLLRRC